MRISRTEQNSTLKHFVHNILTIYSLKYTTWKFGKPETTKEYLKNVISWSTLAHIYFAISPLKMFFAWVKFNCTSLVAFHCYVFYLYCRGFHSALSCHGGKHIRIPLLSFHSFLKKNFRCIYFNFSKIRSFFCLYRKFFLIQWNLRTKIKKMKRTIFRLSQIPTISSHIFNFAYAPTSLMGRSMCWVEMKESKSTQIFRSGCIEAESSGAPRKQKIF